MSWRQDAEYQQRLKTHRLETFREDALRNIRTNLVQIIDAISEIKDKLAGKTIDNTFLSNFEEWFWERNQKAKSEGAEKQLAFMNRLRRYLRIALQVGTDSETIYNDYISLEAYYKTLLEIFSPEKKSRTVLIWERITQLEKVLFPRIGRERGKGPDDALRKLHEYIDIPSCLRLILTPAIPPVIPQKVEQKLFGLSEKIINIFSGITLNFVTDVRWFDVYTPEKVLWKVPGISYNKVMDPFLSDFGVNELKFFEALCAHIGMKIADSKQKGEKFFILDPSFVKVFTEIGYLEMRQQEDNSVIIIPKISEDTLFLQYLALTATNRQGMQPDFAFWTCLVISYYVYQLTSDEYVSSKNVFTGFLRDDLVRVSIIPYTVRAVALQIGGVDWYNIMPVDVETRKDTLSGLLRLARCDFVRLKAHIESYIEPEESFDNMDEEEYLNDPRIWENRNKT